MTRSTKAVSSSCTALLALAMMTACSERDARVDQVQPGISRDSALAVLRAPSPEAATGSEALAPGDSLKNVFRRTAYFIHSKQFEIFWYSPTGEKQVGADTVPKGRTIPVVLIDGKVVGVGHSVYNQVAAQYGLPKNKY